MMSAIRAGGPRHNIGSQQAAAHYRDARQPDPRDRTTGWGSMAFGARHSRALFLGASAFSFALMSSGAAFTQTLEVEAVTRSPEQKKQKQAKRQQATPQRNAQATAPGMNARAPIGDGPAQSLDTITVAASKTEERAIDALAPVSVVTLEQIQGRQPSRIGDLLYNLPGVWVQDRGDEPSTSINIRGLQDFGRVAVVV